MLSPTVQLAHEHDYCVHEDHVPPTRGRHYCSLLCGMHCCMLRQMLYKSTLEQFIAKTAQQKEQADHGMA